MATTRANGNGRRNVGGNAEEGGGEGAGKMGNGGTATQQEKGRGEEGR